MSKDWTPDELQAASETMKANGMPSYEEFCAEVGKHSELISEDMAREIVENIGAVQRDEVDNEQFCPRCGKETMHNRATMNALSRRASVYICPDCGMEEAILDSGGKPPLPFAEWEGVKEYATTVLKRLCNGASHA